VLAVSFAAVLASAAMFPRPALAHGPVAPIALDYRARVTDVPEGLVAKVVDGDQRMWLRVPSDETVVVLDYRGAPYLRFSRAGVEINKNSEMYYLNQTPLALTPPARLLRTTPPSWEQVAGGREYGWLDARLSALAATAIRPGMAFVGRWRIPILVAGYPTAIAGGLWHADPPSIVWLWPIVVLVLCTLAALRLHNPQLDRSTARLLAFGALAAVAAIGIGRGLHGRPGVSVLQLVELGLILAFVAWGLFRVLVQRAGYFSYFVIAGVALWQGLETIPTLFNGFVLMAVPAFVARAATVLALGAAAGLWLMVFRLFDQREESSSSGQFEEDDDGAWDLSALPR
jgi:hypothetical protein